MSVPAEKKAVPTLDEILAEVRALDRKYNDAVVPKVVRRRGLARSTTDGVTSLKNAICGAILRDARR